MRLLSVSVDPWGRRLAASVDLENWQKIPILYYLVNLIACTQNPPPNCSKPLAAAEKQLIRIHVV